MSLSPVCLPCHPSLTSPHGLYGNTAEHFQPPPPTPPPYSQRYSRVSSTASAVSPPVPPAVGAARPPLPVGSAPGAASSLTPASVAETERDEAGAAADRTGAGASRPTRWEAPGHRPAPAGSGRERRRRRRRRTGPTSVQEPCTLGRPPWRQSRPGHAAEEREGGGESAVSGEI